MLSKAKVVFMFGHVFECLELNKYEKVHPFISQYFSLFSLDFFLFFVPSTIS